MKKLTKKQQIIEAAKRTTMEHPFTCNNINVCANYDYKLASQYSKFYVDRDLQVSDFEGAYFITTKESLDHRVMALLFFAEAGLK